MAWQLHKYKSARIVSHRCAPLGADQPDTSYRQCIVRLESEQSLSTAPLATRAEAHKTRAPRWTPSASIKGALGAAEAGGKGEGRTAQTQTVVEYIVLQTRVMEGKEEDWKIWGFTDVTTPAKMEEDDAYWRKMLELQAAA